MVNKKLSELDLISGAELAGDDRLYIADVSAGDNGSKAIIYSQLSSALAVGATGITTGLFNSRADVLSSTIAPAIQWIQTAGYSSPGDFGGGLYVKTPTEPTHEGKIQSADGAWWELKEHTVTLEMFGGKADGILTGTVASGTDNLPAMNAALQYALGGAAPFYFYSADIQCSRGTYYFSGMILVDHCVRILGAGGWAVANNTPATRFIYPANTRGIYFKSYAEVDPITGIANTKDATGAVLERITFQGPGTNVFAKPPVSDDTTKHAIILKTRVRIDNVKVFYFGGDGVNIVGNTGNAYPDCWELRSVSVTACQNAISCDFDNSNAGSCFHIDAKYNRAWGINDSSFLGNSWFGGHLSSNGLHGNAFNLGKWYYCLNAALASTTEPGTNPAVWAFFIDYASANTFVPQWVSGDTFVVGGCFQADNPNAQSVFTGIYVEGDQAPANVVRPSIIFGGPVSRGNRGSGLHFSTDGVNGKFVANQTYAFAANIGMLVTLGVDSATAITGRHSNEPGGSGVKIGWEPTTGTYSMGVAASPIRFNPHNSTLTGGRQTPLGFGQAAMCTGIWLGNSINNIRHLNNNGTAPIIAGEYARGDVWFNFSPTAGGKLGWVCTTSGTIGALWVTGTNYAVNAYILTSAGRYYRCAVDPGGTILSTVEPTHTNTLANSDGYTWHYTTPIPAPPFNSWVSGNTYIVTDKIRHTNNHVFDCTIAGPGTSTIGPLVETDGYSWIYLGTTAPVFKTWGAIDP